MLLGCHNPKGAIWFGGEMVWKKFGRAGDLFQPAKHAKGRENIKISRVKIIPQAGRMVLTSMILTEDFLAGKASLTGGEDVIRILQETF
jgi:hypothetical protein